MSSSPSGAPLFPARPVVAAATAADGHGLPSAVAAYDRARRDDESVAENTLAAKYAELQRIVQEQQQDISRLLPQARKAAEKGILSLEEAKALVPESNIKTTWRSAMKCGHSMRVIGETPDGDLTFDKCCACHRTWKEIMTAAAEDQRAFFHCPSRAGWDALQESERKSAWVNQQRKK